MRTQNIRLLGLTLIWAHNLFVLWAFGFPTVGGLMLGQAQICFYFLTPFTLPHIITHLLSLSIHSIFLIFFPELPTPFLHSLFLFIGKDGWRSYDYFSFLVRMVIQFHHLKVDVWLGRWEWHWN